MSEPTRCQYQPEGRPACRAHAEFIVVDPVEHDPISREIYACEAHVGGMCARSDEADLASFTVVPLPRPGRVFVILNGRDVEVPGALMTYDELVALAGEPGASVTWKALDGRAGMLSQGQRIRPTSGMVFNAIRT